MVAEKLLRYKIMHFICRISVKNKNVPRECQFKLINVIVQCLCTVKFVHSALYRTLEYHYLLGLVSMPKNKDFS